MKFYLSAKIIKWQKAKDYGLKFFLVMSYLTTVDLTIVLR